MNAAADPHFAIRIRASFGRQKAMALIGASLTNVAPGAVETGIERSPIFAALDDFVRLDVLRPEAQAMADHQLPPRLLPVTSTRSDLLLQQCCRCAVADALRNELGRHP